SSLSSSGIGGVAGVLLDYGAAERSPRRTNGPADDSDASMADKAGSIWQYFDDSALRFDACERSGTMHKPCAVPAIAIVVLAGGCAATSTESVVDDSGVAVPPPSDAMSFDEPDMTISMSAFADDTRCEDVTR